MIMSSEVKGVEGNSTLEPVTVLLIFLIIVINQIYLVSLVTVLLRKIKMIVRSSARKYYLFVIFYIASKMLICVILQVKILQGIPDQFSRLDSANIEVMLKNSFVFADCAVIELFLIAFEHYLALSFSIFGNQQVEKVVRVLMQGVQILTFLCLMIPLLIFNVGVIRYETLNAFMSALNCLSVVAFIAGFFFMNFRMTGIMMNRQSSEIIKKVYTLLLVILLSRVLMSALEIWIEINIKNGNFEDFISIIEKTQDKFVVLAACFILYILIILLTEGLPLMLSLRESLIMAFTDRGARQPNISSIITDDSLRDELLINSEVEEEAPQQQPNSRKKSDSQIFNSVESIKDLDIVEKLKSGDDYCIYKAKNKENGAYVLVRELTNISSYIVEELNQEFDQFCKARIECGNPIKVIEEEINGTQKIYIVEGFLEESLQSRIRQLHKANPSLKQLLELSLAIANAIREFHEVFKIGVGVLNPSNIMFTHDNRVKLTGFGMESLKKYLSLTGDYTNITLYTAVELMGVPRQKTIPKANKPADIYSFGVLFYEIISGNEKYRDLSIAEVREKFKKDNFRPKIPDSIDDRSKRIMRKCWQESPESRPDINWVIANLQEALLQT